MALCCQEPHVLDDRGDNADEEDYLMWIDIMKKEEGDDDSDEDDDDAPVMMNCDMCSDLSVATSPLCAMTVVGL